MRSRAIVIVLDGVGAGAAPDAKEFGDHNEPSTLLHVWDAAEGFNAPILGSLGFLSAGGIEGQFPTPGVPARYGRLQELSKGGKDSVTGHWEMMGVVMDHPFPTYPNGFPPKLIRQFEESTGTQTIGNRAASGTKIISELGQLHLDTGFPIVYTSADSVFQIACHEQVVSVDRLYELCRIARELCLPPNEVQRVIARPFTGNPASGFFRTDNRRDFPLAPPPNLIDHVGDVYGIGAVPELFARRGFRAVKRTQNNAEHSQELSVALKSDARFIFANFEDFDMLYGHRNDPLGFARCLEDFDKVLSNVLEQLTAGDLLLITADHGNDPTDKSTDHTREFVPFCLVTPGSAPGPLENLGDIRGMAAIGRTVASHLGIEWTLGVDLLA